MNALTYFKERTNQLRLTGGANGLGVISREACDAFNRLGIPTVKQEEWKYTRINGLFNKEYPLPFNQAASSFSAADMKGIRLPGHAAANELVFVNGQFSASLSVIRSAGLLVMPLEEASKNEYNSIVAAHLGHSSRYIKDGIHALNTAFVQEGMFIHVKKGMTAEHPVYIYHITDARSDNRFSLPRSLVHIDEQASLQVVETFVTLGLNESFTNQVIEIVVEKEASLVYAKIQNDAAHTNQVTTTHIRQVGKSLVHTITISLNGGIIRNNLNVVLDASHAEAHLYGLYFPNGKTHIDNHTVVDNVKPDCFSNELYKGIMDDAATGVFNGKIFVQQQAQKTNAYQSNKNILLSDAASVNTKPQLEIFADDVKCSHGCTVGQLEEEGLFYLQSRGISGKMARSLLLYAFAADILEHIRPHPIRSYIHQLVAARLEFDLI